MSECVSIMCSLVGQNLVVTAVFIGSSELRISFDAGDRASAVWNMKVIQMTSVVTCINEYDDDDLCLLDSRM